MSTYIPGHRHRDGNKDHNINLFSIAYLYNTHNTMSGKQLEGW